MYRPRRRCSHAWEKRPFRSSPEASRSRPPRWPCGSRGATSHRGVPSAERQRPGTAPRALPCFLSMTERRERIARWIQAPSPRQSWHPCDRKRRARMPGKRRRFGAVLDEVLQQGAGSPVMLVLLRASLYQSCAPQYRNANPLKRASDSPDNIITYQFKS